MSRATNLYTIPWMGLLSTVQALVVARVSGEALDRPLTRASKSECVSNLKTNLQELKV